MNVMAPVRALELFKVMTLSSTFVVKLEVPATVITPLSVIVPPVVTARLWPTVTVPRLRFVVPLFMVTSPAPVVLRLTAPVKTLEALPKVMDVPVAFVVKLEAPGTVNAPPVCVIAPPALTVKVLVPRLDVPKFMASVSVIATAFAPEFVRDTAPLKLLAP